VRGLRGRAACGHGNLVRFIGFYWFFVGFRGDPMVLFLLLVIAAIALGILGAVIKGLFFLVIVGPVVFIIACVVLGYWLRSRRRRTPVR
jgi:hypothetical protein